MDTQELMEKLLNLIEDILAQDQKVSDTSIVKHIMQILVSQYGL